MNQPTVYLETFGCQMNELDSELVSGQLRALGYSVTHDPDRVEQADVVLYNTCSVRDLAEQKVRSRLGMLAKRKKTEPGLVVGLLGCMAERDGSGTFHKFPVVDLLCGPAELDKLPSLLDNATKTRQSLLAEEADAAVIAGRSARVSALQGDTSRRSGTLAAAGDSLEMLDLARAISPTDIQQHSSAGAAGRSAYVRITRGCNKFCTYCVVPHTRGAEIHRPPDHIVDECKKLADAGVIEVTLLGQTVNHYRFEHGASVTVGGVLQPQKGRTYKGSHNRDAFAGERVTTFADLLKRIHDEVPALKRIRFVTSYPKDFGEDVMHVIRDSPRICRYLHCPVQSGSDTVLKRMNRGYTRDEYIEWVDRARSILHQPEIGRPVVIAGDIIVGFCGETEEDFELTKSLLRAVRFKNNFIFKYSPRPGTVAYDRIEDDVPDSVKKRRCNELMALQGEISDQISLEQVGQSFEIFVQGESIAQKKKRTPALAGSVGLTVGGQDAQVDQTSDDEQQSGPIQMSGRTDGDMIVVFDADVSQRAALTGTIQKVEIEASRGLTLKGRLIR